MTSASFDWAGVYRDLPREHGFEPLRVEGTLPAELNGTLFRCGPALMSCFGHPYRHPFDGDGAVTAVRFSGGSAWGASRIVDTPGLLAERSAGRPLYPAYGTLPPGARRRLPRPKNAANTSIMAWSHRMFALHEASPPTEFDANDLRTIGETDLGIPEIQLGFSAHPHLVPTRGALYNFGLRYGATTELDLFELRDRSVRRLATVPLAGATLVHDFAATERHLVFFAPPLRLQVRDFAPGHISYGESLAWQPEHGTEVVVVPIDQPSAVIRFTVEPFYQWHFANAFERAGEIVIDFVRYPDFNSNRQMFSLLRGESDRDVLPGTLARAIIDPISRRFRLESRGDTSIEFPRVSSSVESKRHRFVYTVAHSSVEIVPLPHDRVARCEVETGHVVSAEFDKGQYPSEPVFVPRGEADDDGWVVTLVYDARCHASHVAVFDAAHLDAGSVARAWFDHHVPFTFHGLWL